MEDSKENNQEGAKRVTRLYEHEEIEYKLIKVKNVTISNNFWGNLFLIYTRLFITVSTPDRF